MVSGSPRAFPRGYRTGTPARFQDEQALMKYEPKLVLCRCGRRRIGRWKKMCSDCWKEEERARKVALMVEQGSKTRETRLCARIAELSLDIWSPDPIKKLAAVRKLMGACRVLEAHIMNPDIVEQAKTCLRLLPDLKDHEREFLQDIAADQTEHLSDKQASWLYMLTERLTPEDHRQYLSRYATPSPQCQGHPRQARQAHKPPLARRVASRQRRDSWHGRSARRRSGSSGPRRSSSNLDEVQRKRLLAPSHQHPQVE
jgi:hypothetical protein